MSEVELNKLLTPDPVHMSWFLLNWMCLTNQFKILVLYLFLFRKPGLGKDTWWLWTMNFSSNGEMTSVLCLTDRLPSISFHINSLIFLVVVLQIEWCDASSHMCFLVFILQASEVRRNSRKFLILNTFYHLWDPFNLLLWQILQSCKIEWNKSSCLLGNYLPYNFHTTQWYYIAINWATVIVGARTTHIISVACKSAVTKCSELNCTGNAEGTNPCLATSSILSETAQM